MKNKLRIISVVIVSLLVLTYSCKKEVPKVIPSISTTTPTNINSSTAVSGGTISADGGVPVTSRGVCWSVIQNPTTSDNKTADGSGIGNFTSSISGLTPGTAYYVRAYATNSVGTAYGNQVVLTTISTLSTITTIAVTNITTTTATCGGAISADGGAPIFSRGVCWSTSQNPTILNDRTNNGTGTGTFISNITGLTPGTTYYLRAYSTNSIGTSYGVELSFITLAALPTISTTSLSSLTTTSAISGGNITSDGGSTITARGVCWSTNPNPTILNSKTTNGTGTGIFTSNIIGLTPGTTYYLRAYSTNSIGTSYGIELSFKTIAVLPTVSTTPLSSLTTVSVISGGNITSDGGSTITARGVCWSKSKNPTIQNDRTNNGTGTGVFTSNIAGLTPGTTYYLRAYSTNSIGTSYGVELSFKTLAALPTISTTSLSSLTTTSAISGGNITSDGGSTITARGVCWSTSKNPTIQNDRTNNGTGIGIFTSMLNGLLTNTLYYVRAYATSYEGTSYGSEISLFLNINIPDNDVTDIDGNLYHTIKIGTQVWMAENLKTTKYRNGDLIGTTPAALNITTQTNPKYQWSYDGNETNVATYGRFYTWYAATDSRSICPLGWHIPSDAEWTILSNYLGGEIYAGAKLKEIGTNHWLFPNTESTNSTGFTALPTGWRSPQGPYQPIGYYAVWWSSNQVTPYESISNEAWGRHAVYNSKVLTRQLWPKAMGSSVRCVKD